MAGLQFKARRHVVHEHQPAAQIVQCQTMADDSAGRADAIGDEDFHFAASTARLDLHAAALIVGLHAMAHGVFNQRLQQQRRHAGGAGLFV